MPSIFPVLRCRGKEKKKRAVRGGCAKHLRGVPCLFCPPFPLTQALKELTQVIEDARSFVGDFGKRGFVMRLMRAGVSAVNAGLLRLRFLLLLPVLRGRGRKEGGRCSIGRPSVFRKRRSLLETILRLLVARLVPGSSG